MLLYSAGVPNDRIIEYSAGMFKYFIYIISISSVIIILSIRKETNDDDNQFLSKKPLYFFQIFF